MKITCISDREKLSNVTRNINHFQVDLFRGFLNENLSAGSTRYPTLFATRFEGQNPLVRFPRLQGTEWISQDFISKHSIQAVRALF